MTKGRGKGWCSVSVHLLLDQIEQILPAGQLEWAKVEEAYNRAASQFPSRDVDALKRKFALLKNHPKKTGEPDCPSDVRRAKRLFTDIENRMSTLYMTQFESEKEDDSEASDKENEEEININQEINVVSQEKPNRSGLNRSELSELSQMLGKRKQPSTSGSSYVAKNDNPWANSLKVPLQQTPKQPQIS
ncbi:hypothetical protein AC1031_021581 [Aphanomyces cochlioides]|nr:hypothetical protein AC1031_021581 [Aphanomyces cochlioides]